MSASSSSIEPCALRVGRGSVVIALEPGRQVGVVERRERGLAGRGRERREPAADARGQAHGLAAVVAREVGDLEAVEDRELDGLLGAGRELPGRVVELLDLVDGRQVRAAELGEAPARA